MGTLATVAVSRFWETGVLRPIDQGWLDLIAHRTPIVTPESWDLVFWSRLILAATVLLLACRYPLRPGAARLPGAALTVLILGIAVAMTGAWAFPTVLLAQGQAWRWAWLPMVLAVMAVPVLSSFIWRTCAEQRPTLLLGAAALLAGPPAGLILSVTAAFTAILPKRVLAASASVLRVLSVSLLLIALALWLQTFSRLPRTLLGLTIESGATQAALSGWFDDGVLGGIAAWIIFDLIRRFHSPVLASIVGAGVLVTGACYSAPLWMRDHYSNQAHADFQSWRNVMPPDAEVLWGKDPVVVWSLLERRSFLSTDQTAGAVFSREATMHMYRRASESAAIMPSSVVFSGMYNAVWKPSVPALLAGCRSAADLDFVVTNEPLDLPEAAPPVEFPRDDSAREVLRLYSCETLRAISDHNPT
jgi:hypothetical protein